MKNLLILTAILCLISFNSFAENIICQKMKGHMMNYHKDYGLIDFSADTVIVKFNNTKATFIAGQESIELNVIENNDTKMVCLMLSNVSEDILSYYKKEKALFYSKHNSFYQAQYSSICKELK